MKYEIDVFPRKDKMQEHFIVRSLYKSVIEDAPYSSPIEIADWIADHEQADTRLYDSQRRHFRP